MVVGFIALILGLNQHRYLTNDYFSYWHYFDYYWIYFVQPRRTQRKEGGGGGGGGGMSWKTRNLFAFRIKRMGFFSFGR